MIYVTVLDGQFLISSVSSWGPARLGVVSGLATGVAVPWTVSTRVARGLCTLVRGLLSAWVGVISVAALPAALDRDLCQCGWHLKVASSVPQVSLPSHISSVTASVCLGVSVWVCVAVCVSVSVCMSVYLFVYVSVHVCRGGRVGFF